MFYKKNGSKLSEELYDKIEIMKYSKDGMPRGYDSIQWSHLQDAVSCGSISPMEAYEALAIGYVPEHLKVRESRYAHLL